MSDKIIDLFYQKMSKVNFNAYGILDFNMKVHTLGTDSKIIGRIFEMFSQPILEEIAKELGYMLETPESQTVYPDFVLLKDKKSKEKIAVDIKTTYVDNDDSSIKFTLGSYASYMRNNTKNIEYKYTDYIKHYVIGFIYKRNDKAQASKTYDLDKVSEINPPYIDVKYFIQEKYKIAGDKPGSGNTENIGSISTNRFEDFVEGNGPFASLGHTMYDIYWKYYPKYRSIEKTYTCLEEFLVWFEENKDSVETLFDFDIDDLLEKLKDYDTK